MKQAILVVGLLAALLTMAFELDNRVHAKVPFALDEGAQLGSAYPEVMHWPEAVVDEGAQLGSAYPEVARWPEAVADEGAQLGSAYPQITQWPEPVMQVGIRPHPSPGE